VDDVLVSDADRNAVVRQLQRHTADGRLSIDEFSERVEETYRARTATDLQAVLRNLPRASPLVAPTSYRAPLPVVPPRRRPVVVPILLAVIFILVGLGVLLGSTIL
jgi:hypothetical protein